MLLRLTVFVITVGLEIIFEVRTLRRHLGSRRRFRASDALNHQHIVLNFVQHIVNRRFGFEFYRAEPRPRRGPALFLPRKIDHPVVLLRLQCYQVEVQLVGDTVNILIGQWMLPTRIAEHGGKVLGNMLAHPQQRRKAVLTS